MWNLFSPKPQKTWGHKLQKEPKAGKKNLLWRWHKWKYLRRGLDIYLQRDSGHQRTKLKNASERTRKRVHKSSSPLAVSHDTIPFPSQVGDWRVIHYATWNFITGFTCSWPTWFLTRKPEWDWLTTPARVVGFGPENWPLYGIEHLRSFMRRIFHELIGSLNGWLTRYQKSTPDCCREQNWKKKTKNLWNHYRSTQCLVPGVTTFLIQ